MDRDLKDIQLNMGRLVDEAFREVIKHAVTSVIAQHVGSGIDSEGKTAIRAEANRLCREDPEVRQMIRDALIDWIRKVEVSEPKRERDMRLL